MCIWIRFQQLQLKESWKLVVLPGNIAFLPAYSSATTHANVPSDPINISIEMYQIYQTGNDRLKYVLFYFIFEIFFFSGSMQLC